MLSTIVESQAQYVNPNNSSSSKFSLGGDFSIQFFDKIFLVNVSPKLGYNYSEKLMFGPGIIYQYYSDRRFPEFEFTTNIYGASAFARYKLHRNIAAYTEYQQLFYSSNIGGERVNRQIPVWFVGGQFFYNTGGNFTFTGSLLIDLIEDPYSPYGNPYYGLGGFYSF